MNTHHLTAQATPWADHAARLADEGWPVFPLIPGGKVPYARTHGHLDGNQDAKRIARWADRHPNANVGIRPPVGVVVIDVDDREAFAEWLAAHPGLALPPTRTVQTRRGQHLYFRADANLPWRARMTDVAVDIKRANGYVVAPGSVAGGHVYTLTHDVALADLPQLPPEWLPHLTRPGQQEASRPRVPGTPPASVGPAARDPHYYARVLGSKGVGDGRRDCLKWALRKLHAEQTGADRRIALEAVTETALRVGLDPEDVERLVAWFTTTFSGTDTLCAAGNLRESKPDTRTAPQEAAATTETEI